MKKGAPNKFAHIVYITNMPDQFHNVKKKKKNPISENQPSDITPQPQAPPPPFNNEAYSAFKRGNVVKGILCPSLTNSFKASSLERSYLTYSHRQRQKSLIIVNIVDLLLKVVLALVWFWRKAPETEISAEAITWSVCCIFANLGICILGCWRCFANNYLHWAASCTWLLLNLQGNIRFNQTVTYSHHFEFLIF